MAEGESERGDYEAEAPLPHVPCSLATVLCEVAAVFDLRAPFFRASLPHGSRKFPVSRGNGQAGGARARVFAGDPAVVSPRCAEPKSLKIRVRIDNIRISWARRV
ncbi:hypothetical protein ERJ75_000220800 [Trypanosoma vivax]|nr:hypothetical protein ERJ75_000220800 [Trypanosoma vivax]